jgi:hypothetical protein
MSLTLSSGESIFLPWISELFKSLELSLNLYGGVSIGVGLPFEMV